MGDYVDDRNFGDSFIPQIKQIVGPHLLSVTPDEIDVHQAADLMVFTARDMRIAARVRRPGYAARYPYEFTIRAKRDSGADTELKKIVNGWGDWFFYGHSNHTERALAIWWLIDLAAFRAALIRREYHCENKANCDGTYFKAFDLRRFPKSPPILIASSQTLPVMVPA